MSKQPHNPNRRILSAVTASLLLVGCTISPEPLEKMAVEKDVDSSLRYLQRMESPVTQPITLAEAIDRAIGHNLKRKVDALTIALSEKQLDASQLDLLPDLTARAGYAYRDSYAASGSVRVDSITKEPTSSDVNSYSVSQEPRNHTGSVAFSWNILDFGLSYIRANQQADRYLISKEKERKSIQQIQQEVRTAYYQVVAADSLLEKVKPIMSEAAKAYADSEKVAKAQLDSPMNHYNYQRELLEVEKNLQVIERNLLRSRTNLAELMGLKPGTSFRLSEKIMLNYTIPQVQLPMDTLEKVALLNRPELQEARYKERISNKEVKASLLKMLPGIELNSGYSYDSNMYLLSNQWQSLGSNVSWNLLDLFGAGAKREAAKTEVELAKQQKLALCMAIVSQVHIASLEYEQAKKEYALNAKYFKVSRNIFGIVEKENALEVKDKLSYIKEKLNYLVATFRLASSYAQVQNAYGMINISIGRDDTATRDNLTARTLKQERLLEDKAKAQAEAKAKAQAEEKRLAEEARVAKEKQEAARAKQEAEEAAKQARLEAERIAAQEAAQAKAKEEALKQAQRQKEAQEAQARLEAQKQLERQKLAESQARAAQEKQQAALAKKAAQAKAQAEEKVAQTQAAIDKHNAEVTRHLPSQIMAVPSSHGVVFQVVSTKEATIRSTPHGHGKKVGRVGLNKVVDVYEVIPGYKGMSWYKIDGGYVYARLFKKK